jgi:GNAT superfamily N-acetyltransferase
MSDARPVELEMRALAGTAAEAAIVQGIYDDMPAYSAVVSGQAERPGAAQRTFTLLPAGCTRADKHMYLFLHRDRPAGFTDVIRHYPDTNTAYLGLFVLAESFQGRGIGRAAYGALETEIAGWPGITRIELSVVAANVPALQFWGQMGFGETGKRVPYAAGTMRSEDIFFAKQIGAPT